MNPDMRAIEYIKEVAEYLQTATGERITASQMCEKFLFDGTLQWTPIGKLSGGERRRLHLLRVLMDSPNVLLMFHKTTPQFKVKSSKLFTIMIAKEKLSF